MMVERALSDETLTSQGLESKGTSKFLILACGALAREILAVMRQTGLSHIDLQCLPAILHNHPERITPAIEATVKKAREDGYERIFLAYADCGTGGQLQKVAEALNVQMLQGPHCYAFYQGTDDFIEKSEDEFTSFYLTDFLVRQFDAFVWQPLGLDRHPQLLDTYFGHYEKLVYQAQTEDPQLTETARDCAEKLGLTFERRFTGYGELQTSIRDFGSSI